MGFKNEVAEILGHRFGDVTRRMILDKYSDDDPQEIYDVAEHMLSAFMGGKNADTVLAKLVSKYKLKVKIR